VGAQLQGNKWSRGILVGVRLVDRARIGLNNCRDKRSKETGERGNAERLRDTKIAVLLQPVNGRLTKSKQRKGSR